MPDTTIPQLDRIKACSNCPSTQLSPKQDRNKISSNCSKYTHNCAESETIITTAGQGYENSNCSGTQLYSQVFKTTTSSNCAGTQLYPQLDNCLSVYNNQLQSCRYTTIPTTGQLSLCVQQPALIVPVHNYTNNWTIVSLWTTTNSNCAGTQLYPQLDNCLSADNNQL